MTKFEEIIQNLTIKLESRITADSPTEDVKAIGELKEVVECLSKEHEATLAELHDVKDLYIKAMKNEGSKEAPASATEPPKAKSLEDLAKEMLANDTGGK